MEVRNEKLEKLDEDVLSQIVGGLESWRPTNSNIIKDDDKDLKENNKKERLIRYEDK